MSEPRLISVFCDDCVHKEVCQYGAFCPTNHCNDKDTIADLVPWIKNINPDKDGDYLCITGVAGAIYFRQILHFASDLYQIDHYDFYKYRYKRKDQRSGWYDYDSEYGYFEITNVYAWMELPEMPEEFRMETENEQTTD